MRHLHGSCCLAGVVAPAQNIVYYCKHITGSKTKMVANFLQQSLELVSLIEHQKSKLGIGVNG